MATNKARSDIVPSRFGADNKAQGDAVDTQNAVQRTLQIEPSLHSESTSIMIGQAGTSDRSQSGSYEDSNNIHHQNFSYTDIGHMGSHLGEAETSE